MKSRYALLILFALLFLALRVPGLDSPLHQDEYKWPLIVNPATAGDHSIPHPPLGEFIYRTAGGFVGFDVHFRYVPLVFGFANLFLLWCWLRRRAGEYAALWGAALFTLSYYSILASLMVDTDGQVMPFFFLLALIAYDRAKDDWRWWIGVALALVAGFLIKASFLLAIGAIAADVLWERRASLLTREAFRYLGIGVGIVATLVLVLLASQYLFAFFDLSGSVRYWEHFIVPHHNWFQTAIQAVKAMLYLSPLLVLVPFIAKRDDFETLRPLVFFVLFGLIFYLVLFDFSLGALDRYLQFLIVPLVSLAAVVLSRVFPEGTRPNKAQLLLGSMVALGIFAVQFVPQAVPALYPKTEWIGRVLSLHWAFLYPFSGGSGPLTFYVSFLFIGLSWIISGLAAVFLMVRRDAASLVLALLLPVALGYNAAFAGEYLFGNINGSAKGLVVRATEFVVSNPDIERVVVYNDNGGDEIRRIGKYEKRLYTSPDFDWQQKADTMNAFKGHYLVIDAPPIDPDSFFVRYFATCEPVYQDADKYMHATVYDCREAPQIALTE